MKKVLESNEAVSSVVGTILIFAISMISISIILLYAMPALEEMEDIAQTQKVEQAFTIFDSRTSKAALGESPTQSTRISLMGGTVNINGDADAYNKSNIRIQMLNSGTVLDEFTCPMGSIEYKKDDRIIVYEGGGVWSKYPTGRAVMISPPEFHYNGETVTLPAMKINGTSSVSGKGQVDISVNADKMPFVMYPNTTENASRINPIDCDEIYIYVRSEYYDAWADYANTVDHMTATTYDSNNTAFIRLNTLPPMGTYTLTPFFDMYMVDQSSLEPMENFSFRLNGEGAEGLSPFNCEITSTYKNKTLTYYLKESNKQLEIEVKYEDTGASPNYKEHWKGIDKFPIINKSNSFVDLKNDTFRVEYVPPTPSQGGADPDFSWEEDDIQDGNTSFTLNDLTQHYIKLLTEDSSVKFKVLEKQEEGKLDFNGSKYTLIYDHSGSVITYLHVTRNELYVTLSN